MHTERHALRGAYHTRLNGQLRRDRVLRPRAYGEYRSERASSEERKDHIRQLVSLGPQLAAPTSENTSDLRLISSH